MAFVLYYAALAYTKKKDIIINKEYTTRFVKEKQQIHNIASEATINGIVALP